MKSLAHILFVIFSSVGLTQTTLAAKATPARPQFRCQTEMPSTTFESKMRSGSLLSLEVTHHFGVQYLPIHSGVITVNDLAYLQNKAEVMKKLGDHFTLTFKPENCESFGDELFYCFSRDEVNLNGTTIKGYNFSTRVIKSNSLDSEYKTNQVVFSFFYEGVSYDMPMNYAEGECNFPK